MSEPIIWNKAAQDAPVLILAHGAGAPMDSEFMENMAELLVQRGISVARFEFPYMQQRRTTGKKRPPGRQPILLEHWHKVLTSISATVSAPVFMGGKSMGGRMATLLAAQLPMSEAVSGVVCLGYPFYAIGKKDKPRIEHLKTLTTPTLIIQGERDSMGDRETVEGYRLSSAIDLHWLVDGNHDLKPRKASGFDHRQHMERAAGLIIDFIG